MEPFTPFSRGRNRRLSLLLVLPFLYACWLGMMCVHEAGHVLHAWASGGTVAAVRVPLLGFSITEFSANPHPHFVAWGGAIGGSVLPLIVWLAFAARRWRGRGPVQFFAGFCLVANGLYLAVGWTARAGDAGDLRRYGTPVWVMVVAGGVAAGAGLYLWHRLGAAGWAVRNGVDE
jgi:hypothetical protein